MSSLLELIVSADTVKLFAIDGNDSDDVPSRRNLESAVSATGELGFLLFEVVDLVEVGAGDTDGPSVDQDLEANRGTVGLIGNNEDGGHLVLEDDAGGE